MIIEVGDIIKGYLAQLPFIDKLAGVVKVITKIDLDDNQKQIIKKFPVACNVSSTDCNAAEIIKDLIPDSSKGCIVFLEDMGLRFNGMRGRKQQWKGSYKIIGWVNNLKLGKDECSVTGKIVASIIKQFPIAAFNNGNYQTINIQPVGQEPKSGNNPFSKYTFNESETQYLMYPYDYFSLLVDINFEFDERCLTELVVSDAIACK